MKRVITISLALLMVFLAFAGCSKGGAPEAETNADTKAETTEQEQVTVTKEELLKQDVTTADINTMAKEASANAARAKQKYCNKVLKISGTVYKIDVDSVVLTDDSYYYRLYAYLPEEELVKLEKKQTITIVGKTNDTLEIDENGFKNASWDCYKFEMPSAYLA